MHYTGVIIISYGFTTHRFSSSRALEMCMLGRWQCLRPYDGTIVQVISNTCAFPANVRWQDSQDNYLLISMYIYLIQH